MVFHPGFSHEPALSPSRGASWGPKHAGVVSLAIARALALRGVQVLLLEKDDRAGRGTSSRSSEVIHAGLYYEP